jgi:hypothetical protein
MNSLRSALAADMVLEMTRRKGSLPALDPEKWVPVFGQDHAPKKWGG